MATCNKLEVVMDWLKVVFDEDPIPRFDKSQIVIDQLYDLMISEAAFEKTHSINSEFNKQCSLDYAVKAQQLLDISNLNSDKGELQDKFNFPEINVLSNLASMLSLSNTDECSYILALSDLLTNKETVSSQVDILQIDIKQKHQDLANILVATEQLDHLVSNVKEEEPAIQTSLLNQAKDAEFMQQKLLKYKADKNILEKQLIAANLTKETTHQKIAGDYEEIVKLQIQLSDVKAQLDMFANLPPDKDLAQVKLALAKAELADLEDKLSKQIDMYHI